jgi:hypothetical protein
MTSFTITTGAMMSTAARQRAKQVRLRRANENLQVTGAAAVPELSVREGSGVSESAEVRRIY